MTDQSLTNRVRERLKLAVRRGLQRADLEISRGSYASRLTATAQTRGIDTVLDVGANVGQFASLLRSAGYRGRIVSVEPLAGAFAQLQRRSGEVSAWTAVNAAVGAEVGETVIHVAEDSYSSSILPATATQRTAAPRSAPIGEETVRMTTVRDLVSEHGLDPARTLLKVDTQGFEEDVLRGAGDLIGAFAAIQLELSFVELYAGQRLYEDLVADLGAAGYRIHQLETGFSDQQGRLMQVDGLFVRVADDG